MIFVYFTQKFKKPGKGKFIWDTFVGVWNFSWVLLQLCETFLGYFYRCVKLFLGTFISGTCLGTSDRWRTPGSSPQSGEKNVTLYPKNMSYLEKMCRHIAKICRYLEKMCHHIEKICCYLEKMCRHIEKICRYLEKMCRHIEKICVIILRKHVVTLRKCVFISRK